MMMSAADPFEDLPSPALSHAFDVTVTLAQPEEHSWTSAGHRRVVPIIGGSIRGSVDADILPGGADWQIVRPDGTIEIDSRYSARTPDGAFLLLHARGLRTGDPDVLERLRRGDDVDPSTYYFRTTVAVETASESISDLQRHLFVAVARRQVSTVLFRAYRVR